MPGTVFHAPLFTQLFAEVPKERNILYYTCFLLPPLEEYQADVMDASICFGKSEKVKTLPAEGLEAELSLILYS